MTSLEKISNYLTVEISKQLKFKDKNIKKLEYGIRLFILNITELFIIFTTAYFLGLFKFTLVFFCSFFLIRVFAFGVHAKSFKTCMLITTIIYLGNAYIAKYYSFNDIKLRFLLIVSTILLALYAPADTKKRPLTSIKMRNKLKIKALISELVLIIIMFIIDNYNYKTCIALAIINESILITPIIYKIFGEEYKNYEKIIK